MSREGQMTKWWLPRWLARAILPELSTASSRHWLQSPRTSSWGLGRLTTFCALFRSALQYDFLITARITELILGGGVCKVGCAFPGDHVLALCQKRMHDRAGRGKTHARHCDRANSARPMRADACARLATNLANVKLDLDSRR
jgi:hypothetical protein